MRIEVAGIPAPQGSKRHVGGGRMVESSRAVGPWREAVRAETQRALKEAGAAPFDRDAGVHLSLAFWLPRPKSLPKRVKFPAKRPDLDKLVRAVLDGLVDGGAMADDCQVLTIDASKQFALQDYSPGCEIEIWEA